MVSSSIRRLILVVGSISIVIVVLLLILRPDQSDTMLAPGSTLRVGVDPSMPPFASIQNNELVGLEIDLARQLASELDVNVHFVTLGFDSLYDALLTEQVDCIIAALVIDPGRMDDVIYTRPYYDDGLQLISRNLNKVVVGILAGKTLSFEFGSEADSVARQWSIQFAALERRPYERPSFALDALFYEESDAALVDTTSYLLYASSSNTQFHTESVTHVPFAIGIARERNGLAQQLDQALKTLQQTGVVDMLIRKWF